MDSLSLTLILILALLFLIPLSNYLKQYSDRDPDSETNIFFSNGLTIENIFLIIVFTVIFIFLIVFYTFTFIFAVLIIALFYFLNNVYINSQNFHRSIIEKFPVYITPLETKTYCDANNDGCKPIDNIDCQVCQGGIYNRRW